MDLTKGAKPFDETKFLKVKKHIINTEIAIAIDEDFPNRENYIKRALKIQLESNPKKFVKRWMRLTGATKFDLPKNLETYYYG